MVLYRLGTSAYFLAIRLAAKLGVGQAKTWVEGRKDQTVPRKRAGRKRIWLHCASLGEWEQGRPVLEALRKQRPEWEAVVSFFSPSGYERLRGTAVVDHVLYLPPDAPSAARDWLDQLQPDVAVFVKYEFWFYHLRALAGAGVPTFLVAAHFRPGQPFFKRYGSLHRKMLGFYTAIITQSAASVDLLNELNLPGHVALLVGGDPRVDRTLHLVKSAFTDPVLANFCAEGPTVIAGSVWPEDLKVWQRAWPAIPEKWRIVFAPHVIDETAITNLQTQWQALRYTRLEGAELPESRVLILDTIGMLSRSYRYGKLAYVGGAFRTGLHNTLEPMAYGLPTIFGPNHDKFPEAAGALAAGGAYSIDNGDQLAEVVERMDDEVAYYSAVEAQRRVALANSGAGERTAAYILKLLPVYLLLCLLPVGLAAQRPPSPTQALSKVYGKANLVTALTSYSWQPGMAMTAAVLPVGETIEREISLEAGREYVFIAACGARRAIVDCYLLSGDRPLTGDEEDDNSPVLRYTPDTTGSYTIRLYARAADRKTVALALAILQEGGVGLPAATFRRVLRTFSRGNEALFELREAVTWSKGWCIYAFTQRSAKPQQIENLRFYTRRHLATLAGASESAISVLYLADESHRIAAFSAEPTAYPLLEVPSLPDSLYTLRIEPKVRDPQPLLLLGLLQQ